MTGERVATAFPCGYVVSNSSDPSSIRSRIRSAAAASNVRHEFLTGIAVRATIVLTQRSKGIRCMLKRRWHTPSRMR
jgi:hypothetical protein